ncbi:MAG: acetyltransferase [Muribaculaceae bacterium]|nr:acetyltransferase [Muribaculaceae bacterium]
MGEIERKWSLAEIIRLGFWTLRSRLFFRGVRLIRFPIYLRGKEYIDLGHGLTTGTGCRLEAMRIKGEDKPVLRFGDRVQLNDHVHICALKSVVIGNDVLMASNVYISDNSHGIYKGPGQQSSPEERPLDRSYHRADVEIGDRVWLGEGVIVMPGVTIGSGSVIGAHSVVNRSIPSDCIAVGSPAKIIKKYNHTLDKWEAV